MKKVLRRIVTDQTATMVEHTEEGTTAWAVVVEPVTAVRDAITPLAFPVVRDGFDHRLLQREGPVCLVARVNRATGSTHFEVVRLRRTPAWTTPDGRVVPAAEVYPSTARWGIDGWTYTTGPEAEARFAAVVRDETGRVCVQRDAKAGSARRVNPKPLPTGGPGPHAERGAA